MRSMAMGLEGGGCCQLQHFIVIHGYPMGNDLWPILYALHIKNILVMCENIKRKTC